MRIAIHHEIVQDFAPPIRSAIQVLRLRPKDCESQHVVSWNVDVNLDCGIRESRDAFGNFVQTLDCEGPIDKLVIVARGEVDTSDTAGVLRGEIEKFPIDVFLRDTDYTTADAALRDFALATVKGAKTQLDRPHFLMRAVHDVMKIEPGAPVSAAEAFKRKSGGSADFAHVFIAAARAVGLPARCVSGYLSPDENDGEPGAHVWAEVFVEGLGWIGFDPAICLCMFDGHVRVAAALDYLGCAPQRIPPFAPGERIEKVSVKPLQATHQRQA